MTAMTRSPEPKTWSADSRIADLLRNAGAGALLWLAYAAVRGLTAGDLTSATENAVAIMDLQRSLGLPSEAAVQRAVLDHPWLLRGANVYYIGVHFPATIGFLLWAWLCRRSHFSRIRNSLILVSGVGLVLHVLYPLKPPRMMGGFVDTAAVFGPDPYELSISGGANQFAAMPSLHVGWALLVAIGFIATATSRMRWLALLHPVVTLAVVVITANHYWLDAAVAVGIFLTAWTLGRSGVEERIRTLAQVATALDRHQALSFHLSSPTSSPMRSRWREKSSHKTHGTTVNRRECRRATGDTDTARNSR
jgi:hypothetical protein